MSLDQTTKWRVYGDTEIGSLEGNVHLGQVAKKLIKEHGKRVAPNDFEKTKLARKYNPKTKFYDETIEEIVESCSL